MIRVNASVAPSRASTIAFARRFPIRNVSVGLPSCIAITMFDVNATRAVARANFENTRPVASAVTMRPVTASIIITVSAAGEVGLIVP